MIFLSLWCGFCMEVNKGSEGHKYCGQYVFSLSLRCNLQQTYFKIPNFIEDDGQMVQPLSYDKKPLCLFYKSGHVLSESPGWVPRSFLRISHRFKIFEIEIGILLTKKISVQCIEWRIFCKQYSYFNFKIAMRRTISGVGLLYYQILLLAGKSFFWGGKSVNILWCRSYECNSEENL